MAYANFRVEYVKTCVALSLSRDDLHRPKQLLNTVLNIPPNYVRS